VEKLNKCSLVRDGVTIFVLAFGLFNFFCQVGISNKKLYLSIQLFIFVNIFVDFILIRMCLI